MSKEVNIVHCKNFIKFPILKFKLLIQNLKYEKFKFASFEI